MRLVRDRSWCSEVWQREPFIHYNGAAELARLSDWPDCSTLQGIAHRYHQKAIFPFEFVYDGPARRQGPRRSYLDFYEPFIYLTKKIPLRNADWHDLFNVLVWLTFPQTKTALNRFQYLEFIRKYPDEPIPALSNRSATQDKLSQIDECAEITTIDGVKRYLGHGALECVFYGNENFGPLPIRLDSAWTNWLDLDARVLRWLVDVGSSCGLAFDSNIS